MPIILPDEWNDLNNFINRLLIIPDGYEEPDLFLISIKVLVDNSQKKDYTPSIRLHFGSTYIDDKYLEIIYNLDGTYTPYEED